MSDVTPEGAGERTSEELEREPLIAAVCARERFLEGILGSLESFATIDRDWRLTFVNEAAARLARSSPEALLGRDIREVVSEATLEQLAAPLPRVMSQRDTVEFDIADPGRQRHYRGKAYPLADGGLALYVRDVTERVRAEEDRERAEETLRANEQLLQTVLAHSREGINMLDLTTGRYLFMNEAQVALTGFDREELDGISTEEAQERVHPDDRHISVEQQRRVAAGEDHEQPVEYRWMVKSGEYRWFSDRRRIVRDARGAPVALVGISRDITASKEAEAASRLQNLILGGIATILEAALAAATEEKLGEVCLQVAEQLSESEFGFIGEIDAADTLRVVATSDPGWRQCSMRERNGDSGLPDAFELHGLCGRVVRTGEPLVANTPATHLVSVGLPEGHPPLTSFLGVPLKDGDCTTGMVAVANRPGGYREKHLEGLQVIAPVIREAFERRRAENTLRANEVFTAAQQERNRLARDLHDLVTQALFAAAIKAEALTLDGSLSAETTATVEEVRRLTRGAQAQMRTLLLELRADPLEQVPLRQLLRHLVEATESRASTSVRLTVRGDAVVSTPVHVMLYRVVQEALNNVVRHAKAKHAWVVLDLRPGAVHLVVGDDGHGFDASLVDAGHLGLRSMRERAAEAGAELRIVPSPEHGTEIVVDWSEEAGEGGPLAL